jgi:hypothetical protein
VVKIENRGNALAPAVLRATTDTGEVVTVEVGVERWFGGAQEVEVSVEAPSRIMRLEIVSPLPDVGAGNGIWVSPLP